MKKIYRILALLLFAFTLGCTKCSKDIKVHSIEIHNENMQTFSIDDWDTFIIDYSITPSNATNKNVTFSVVRRPLDEKDTTVYDGEFSFIDETGQVFKPPVVGKYDITVTTEDGEKTATLTIIVDYKNVTISSISLNKVYSDNQKLAIYKDKKISYFNVKIGATFEVETEITPINVTSKSFNFEISDESIIELVSKNPVNGTAVFRTLSTGVATIKAICFDNINNVSKEATIEARVSITGIETKKEVVDIIATGIKNSYLINEEIDISDIKLSIIYNDNSVIEEVLVGSMLDRVVDTKEIGDNVYTITYDGFEKQINIKVLSIKPIKVEMIKPLKNEYKINEKVGNVVFTFTYNDGTIVEKKLTEVNIVEEFSSVTAGQKNLIINYDGSDDFSFSYTVVAKIAKNITIIGGRNVDDTYKKGSVVELNLLIEFENPIYINQIQKIKLSTTREGNNTYKYTLFQYQFIYNYVIPKKVVDIDNTYFIGNKQNYNLGESIETNNIFLVINFTSSFYPTEMVKIDTLKIASGKFDYSKAGDFTVVFMAYNNKFSLKYTILPKEVVKYEIIGLKDKYKASEGFDKENVRIVLEYKDPYYHDETIYLNSNRLSFYDGTEKVELSNAVGVHNYKIKVDYLNVSIPITYEIVKKEVKTYNLINKNGSILENRLREEQSIINIDDYRMEITYTDSIYDDENKVFELSDLRIVYANVDENNCINLNVGENKFVVRCISNLWFNIEVVKKEIKQTYIDGLNDQYTINTKVDFDDCLLVTEFTDSLYDDEVINLFDLPTDVYSITGDLINLIEDDHLISIKYLDNDFTTYIDVIAEVIPKKEVTKIELLTSLKDEYKLNEIINLKILVSYNHISYKNTTIDVTPDMLIVNQTNLLSIEELTATSGLKDVTITYGNLTIEDISINVVSKEISKIEILTFEKKINLNNKSVLKIELFFTNDIYENEIKEIDLVTNSIGEKKYSELYYGYLFEYEYVVLEKEIIAFELIGLEKNYKINELINKNKLKIKLKYNDSEFYPDEIIAFSDEYVISGSLNSNGENEVNNKSFKLKFGEIENEYFYSVIGICDITLTDPLAIKSKYKLNDSFEYSNINIDIHYYNDIFPAERVIINPYIVNITDIPRVLNVAGDYSVKVKVNNYSTSFDFKVVDKIIDNDKSYFINSIPTTYIKNTSISSYISGNRLVIVYTDEIYEPVFVTLTISMITGFDSKTLGSKQMKVIYNDLTIKTIDYTITDNEVSSIVFFGLEEVYVVTSQIDLNSAYITVMYKTGGTKNVKMKYVTIISGEFSTAKVGEYTVEILYENKTATFSYVVEDKLIENIILVGCNNSYGYLTTVDTSKWSLKVNYSNYVSETLPISDATLSELRTSTLGKYEFTVSYKNVEIKASYMVEKIIFIAYDEVKVPTNDCSIVVTVNKSLLAADYELETTGTGYTINSITKNDNGNFIVNLHIIDTDATININLKNYLQVETMKIIIADIIKDVNFSIICSDTIKKDTNTIIYAGADSSVGNVTYEFSIVEGNDLASLESIGDYASLKATNEGTIKIKLVVSSDGKSKEIYKEIKIVYQYSGLKFADDLYTYGISDVYAVANSYVYKYLTSYMIGAKTNVFKLTSADENAPMNPENFIWSTSDSSIATFNEKGELNIISDGEVYLYAIAKNNQLLGIGDSTKATFKVRCVNGVEVDSYEGLKKAISGNYQIVIKNNINIGPTVMTLSVDKNGKTIRTPLYSEYNTKAMIKKQLISMPYTWDDTYQINYSKTSPVIYSCINFNNNVYGNGYTLDAYNVTTIGSVLSAASWYNGPAVYVGLMGVSVYGQDNAVFTVGENVTIDNITLQACDDAYFTSNGVKDYTKLKNVGTTLEVLGDNVNIVNSMIRNGRTCIRAYGTDNPEDVINVKIKNCIIENACEYLLKMGANKYKSATTQITYNNKLTNLLDVYKVLSAANLITLVNGNQTIKQQLFDTSTTFLTKRDGTRYLPEEDNSNDEYFTNNYIKTFITLEDSVLINCNFFAIGMESKFSGPCLGGYQYTTIYSWNGWYGMTGTSYAAKLNLVGDVRIYNWMRLTDLSATAIFENNSTSEDIKQIQFDVGSIIRNAKWLQNNRNLTSGDYFHAGIFMFGGGKNYSIVDLKDYSGPDYLKFSIEMSNVGDSMATEVAEFMLGKENFRMYVYSPYASIKYTNQEEDIKNKKYLEVFK